MIVAAGLTPARQQILAFDRFRPGEVNRAREAHWCASGKVLNAGIALHYLRVECKTLTVVGGASGEEIRREFDEQDIPARWVESSTPTRTCTTILDGSSGKTTELVENSGPLTDGELDVFRAAYAEEAGSAGAVVLSGSLPAGTPATFYRELLEKTPGPAILDIRGPELLEALACRPLVVKPNRRELEKTVGRALDDDRELVEAMRELNDRGASWVVVTQGGDPIIVTNSEKAWQIEPIAGRTVNPIGCGDCLAAGIAAAVVEGRQMPDAARFGVAAAFDNLGRLLPAQLDRRRIEASVGKVAVAPLD